MSDILTEFEQRIAENKRALEEQEHALAVLKRTMGQTSVSQIAPAAAGAPINFNNLVPNTIKNKKAVLADEVRTTVALFGNHEFTLAHIEAALKQRGIEVKSKQPRARINAALGEVIKDDFVKRVKEGVGNAPHYYKLKSAVDNKP